MPILRIAAGIAFIAAGLLYFSGANLGPSIALILVVAGFVVIALTLGGHRAHGWDIALFVVSLLIFGGVSSGYGTLYGPSPSSAIVTYSSARSTQINQIDVLAKANAGSVSISFSSNASILYRVTFTRYSFPFFFFPGSDAYSLMNATRGSILLLNASSSIRNIGITLPSGYFTDINASTGAGSVSLTSSNNESFGYVSLSTGAGSVNANMNAEKISYLYVETGSGSINFASKYLSPSGARVPVTLSTGAGSANIGLSVPQSAGVSISASTGVGSINQVLSGFTITKSTGTYLSATTSNFNNATDSFAISISTGTGSVSIKIA